MRLQRKIASFLRLGSGDRLMVCEAIMMLAAARLVVITVPFRRLTSWLSRTPDSDISDKIMLTRRGQGSAFHLGATFDKNGKLVAHAWLVVGDTVVAGAAGIPGMSPLARFG